MVGQDWLNLLKQHRVIAVIRTESVATGLAMARAVAAGGIHLIEVTWNSHQPATMIEVLRAELPHCIIGCGTLLNRGHIKDAISAGAQYGFMPHVDPVLIAYGREQDWPIHPGALTPTEMMTAWNAGASGVKVFPVAALGGCEYIRNLQGPLSHIPLIPTGGVTLDNAKAFLEAGAIAVGLAGDLFPRAAVLRQDWEEIRGRSQQLIQTLTQQRAITVGLD
jgi:2-dehydro-3-deoxyphosphogluconate aldolase / (4S)-4-hydroxy-2-oxoglutarate aldolase